MTAPVTAAFPHHQVASLDCQWNAAAAGRYQKKQSSAHTHPDYQTSFINFLHLLWSIASSLFSLRAWQSFSTDLEIYTNNTVYPFLCYEYPYTIRFSLVFLLVLDHLLHTRCISSPSHYLLFVAHAHTVTACSAVIPMLCHLYLVSLSVPYLEIFFSLMPHIHLTILISARWSATSFSFLAGQVSLPCNILLRTQLLYNLPLNQWYVLVGKQWYHSSSSTCSRLGPQRRSRVTATNSLPPQSCSGNIVVITAELVGPFGTGSTWWTFPGRVWGRPIDRSTWHGMAWPGVRECYLAILPHVRIWHCDFW